MKILQINTFGKGGAANACIGLHLSLLQKGIDSKLLTLYKSSRYIPQQFAYKEMIQQPKKNLLTKLQDKLLQRKAQQRNQWKKDFLKKVMHEADHFSFLDTPYDITQLSLYKEADIINLHWMAEFLDWPSFFAPKNKKRIVWTLHDMHPFTGGYHYAGNYQGYLTRDEYYPPAQNTHFPNLAQHNLQRKKDLLGQSSVELEIVSPSVWLANLSQKSALFKKYPHHTIPNSVNTQVFRPLNKEMSREILGLPMNKLILFFVSQDISKQRKGFKTLLDSLQLLSNQRELVVCSAGKPNEEISLDQAQHIPLNNIEDQRLMAVAYNAADAFVIPSMEDNLPNTVLEALACATPVLGFSTGGIKDMVINSFNGYLSEEMNAKGLAETIKRYIQSRHELHSSSIRKDAVDRFSPEVQAAAYERLYTDLLKVK